MRKILIVIAFVELTCFYTHAQQPSEKRMALSLQQLSILKYDYERFIGIRKDSLFAKYIEQIQDIKKHRKEYAGYIDVMLTKHRETLAKSRTIYRNPSTWESNTDPDSYLIRYDDFYQIVKIYLLEKDDFFLPITYLDLTFIDQKKYNGYYKLVPSELKKSTEFIKNNLPLTKKEITFLDSETSPRANIAIAMYIKVNGNNEGTTKFIKWAIEILVKEPRISLGELEITYSVKNLKDVTPKDKPVQEHD